MTTLDAPAHTLQIAGLEPFSSVDWPGKLAATLFLQGCPWKCTYCHNVEIIDCATPGQVAWDRVLELLQRRRGLLDAVVFSGGEPTRQAGLLDGIGQVKDLGYQVGLHTAGPYPRRLEQVLELVDWVGLDIKATPEKYRAITGVQRSAATAYQALDMVLQAQVPLQVRTTLDPTVLTVEDVALVQREVARRGVGRPGPDGVCRSEHVIQQVRSTGVSPAYAQALSQVEPLALG